MDEILGLVDALEAQILSAQKIPLTDKIMLTEKKLLNIIDKIRIVIKSEEDVVRKSIELQKREIDGIEKKFLTEQEMQTKVPLTIIQNAEKEAEKIKEETNSYADYILSNLQLMITKMQKNILHMEKSIEDGRQALEQEKTESVIAE